MNKKFLIGFLMTCVTVMGQNTEMENNHNEEVHKGTIVDIETTMGDMKVLLYDETPLHKENFLKLVKEGFYDGVLFHRVINEFMIQTGDPQSKGYVGDKELGDGDRGYTIEAEINYPRYFHKKGALAAARTADQVNPQKRSSSSQFYIVTGKKYTSQQLEMMERQKTDKQRSDFFQKLVRENWTEVDSLQKKGDESGLEELRQKFIKETEANVPEYKMPDNIKETYINIGGTPHLDGNYTVFGEVLSGMDTVEKIEKAETNSSDRPKEDIRIISMRVEK